MSALLCIPTLNPGHAVAGMLVSALGKQSLQPDKILIIDSGSTDGSPEIFRRAGADVLTIDKKSFNHGGTRQLAAEGFPWADMVVFLTQDALPATDRALEDLLACLGDSGVGAAYGRQLPRHGAKPIEAHARLFNYPEGSQVKALADASRMGIKAAFMSNSFAAYRRDVLLSVGGFPSNTILGEDMYVAGKMLLSGWRVAYCAEAAVYHSHNYGWTEEFKRYFDTGVFHARQPWIRKTFGGARGEGLRFVRSELRYLSDHAPLLIYEAFVRSAAKMAGYKVGAMERILPLALKRRLSMHPSYWDQARTTGDD
jgi:rhamnosyltransferase